jgi:hypothetical protein
MRRFSFLEWLDEATTGPFGRIVKRVVLIFTLIKCICLGLPGCPEL